ncbi:MAG: hypothetical protein QM638_22055 [Nocardioides sp.]|uniref:hypothetical protein n=1 Tax=Nocardioides sp. TaxID=35761 RepID=UPI0039E45819
MNRMPYDDPSAPAELVADCRAADGALSVQEQATIDRALTREAPSIRFEDFPSGLPKRDVDMLAAARHLARSLNL